MYRRHKGSLLLRQSGERGDLPLRMIAALRLVDNITPECVAYCAKL
jgi:hypothetical protein